MRVDVFIRAETDADIDDIRDVTDRAFSGVPYSDGTEAAIVDALRSQRGLALSLVAEHEGRIIGHVAFSPASVTGWYALGPISVDPKVQRSGIGSALILEGLGQLRDLRADGCMLVGDEKYYQRFGFEVAPGYAPAGVPREHFMVLLLGSKSPPGVLHFHPAFGV